MTRPLLAALLVSGLSAAAARAEPEVFGSPGRIMVSGSVSLLNVSTDAAGSSAVTTLDLAPALQIFIARNVALGFEVDFLLSSGGSTFTSIGFLPSLGYNFDLAVGISFLPQLRPGLSVSSLSTTLPGTPPSTISTTVTRLSLGVFAPFIFRPAGAFFIGFGPHFQQDVLAGASRGDAPKQTVFGLQTQVGGWF